MTVEVGEGLRLRSGRYELESRLGRGGAATVWLARDTLLERPVAIKILAEGLVDDHDWLTRFRREARIAAQLQHPNLVSIYDFNADVERPYIVMEYMPGGSLLEAIEAGNEVDAERLAVDLLSALSHIHEAGIVHRDVKPANVLLDADGRACLTDFGIARPQDATSITQTGHIPGTARYMAPELWRGDPASEASDLYSCGVLLSECLGDDIPARLLVLTERLTAENPELRPESAQAALGTLGERAAVHVGPDPETAVQPPDTRTDAVPPEAEGVRAPPGPRRARWLPLVALCLVALVGGFLFANAFDGGDDPQPADERKAAANSGNGEGSEEVGEIPPTTDDASTDGGGSSGAEAPPADPALDGFELNEQGKALIDQGRYDQAIPLLEDAVAALEGSGDITYYYALYNLGNALRLAGRPAEAIPILEKRLENPDQKDVVKAELERAKEDLKAQEKAAED